MPISVRVHAFRKFLTSGYFQMAEVHYLGQIASGTNFPENRLCVRFKVKTGSGWKLISG